MTNEFPTGEDVLLRREFRSKDSACKGRDYFLTAVAICTSAAFLVVIGGSLYWYATSKPFDRGTIFAIIGVLLFVIPCSTILFFLPLSMTGFCPTVIYCENMRPGILEQRLLHFTKSIKLADAEIKIRKKGFLKYRLVSVTPRHGDPTIHMGALTEAETGLILAYQREAKKQSLQEDSQKHSNT